MVAYKKLGRIQKRTAEYRISNHRISKDGIAALYLNKLKLYKSIEFLTSIFDIHDSIFDIYAPLEDSLFLSLFCIKKVRTNVSFPGAGYDGYDGFASGFRALGNLQRGPNGCAG